MTQKKKKWLKSFHVQAISWTTHKMKNRCTMFWNLSKSCPKITLRHHRCFLLRFLNVVIWSNSESWIENIYCFPSASNGITQKLPFLKMINNVKYKEEKIRAKHDFLSLYSSTTKWLWHYPTICLSIIKRQQFSLISACSQITRERKVSDNLVQNFHSLKLRIFQRENYARQWYFQRRYWLTLHEIKLWNIKLINFFCYVIDEILGGFTSSFSLSFDVMQHDDVFLCNKFI